MMMLELSFDQKRRIQSGSLNGSTQFSKLTRIQTTNLFASM